MLLSCEISDSVGIGKMQGSTKRSLASKFWKQFDETTFNNTLFLMEDPLTHLEGRNIEQCRATKPNRNQ